MRLRCLLAACGLFFSVAQANADLIATYQIIGDYFALPGAPITSGTFSGTIQADITTDQFIVGSPNIITTNLGTLDSVFSQGYLSSPPGPYSLILQTDPSGPLLPTNLLGLVLALGPGPASGLGTTEENGVNGDIQCSSGGGRILCGEVTFAELSVQSVVSITPLPPALPLFASGLGALGLLGWRRKWKQIA